MDERLVEALNVSEIMALSTNGPDGSWVSPVHFTYGTDAIFTFVSDPGSKHGQNIAADKRVAAAIYQLLPSGSLGLQIVGEAIDLDASTVKQGVHTYQVKPHEIWIVDNRGERRPRERLL